MKRMTLVKGLLFLMSLIVSGVPLTSYAEYPDRQVIVPERVRSR